MNHRQRTLYKVVKPIATRTILPHVEPCWECSRPLISVGGWKKSNKDGPYLAYIAHIEGHNRKLHGACAKNRGFSIDK